MAKNENKIPYEFAVIVADEIVKDLETKCWSVHICGSIRRKAKTVADIDIVVLSPREDLVGKTSEILVQGDRKISYNYFYKEKHKVAFMVQVDIMIAHDTMELAPMILHCTGSKWSNIKMRRQAKDKGLKLNEYGLWYGVSRMPCHNEQDIYKHLGLEYIEPKNRN